MVTLLTRLILKLFGPGFYRRRSSWGGVDIVINNTSASASIEWTDEAWHKSFNVDLMAAVTMNETALPFLEKSSAAAILQVATVTSFEHHDMSVCPSYGAIKAATVNYSAQLAQNWGDKNIRANSVSPRPNLY